MWMNQLTIINGLDGTYTIHVSDGRNLSGLNEIELIEEIKKLINEKTFRESDDWMVFGFGRSGVESSGWLDLQDSMLVW